MAGSAESTAVLSRLTAAEGSLERIEKSIFLREVLDHLNTRERKIAIWKKGEYSSQFIAEKLGMSVASVDTAYSRLRQKARRMIGRGRWLGL
jgi:DNA-directed RNA polymerase specialized sigma24 family protein